MSSLTLLHVGHESIGYGRLGVKLDAELRRRGITLWDSQGNGPPDLGAPAHTDAVLRNLFGSHASGKPDRPLRRVLRPAPHPTAAVSWISVPSHARWWHRGQHTSVFTMWEAQVLPESFRENLHEIETIIVPSLQNVELFSKYHDNVRYAPLGVDPAEWHYVERPEPEQEFRFLIGGSGSRKGTDLAYKAFRAVFPKPELHYPRPVLVMKNPKGEDYYGPGIEIISGRLTPEDEQALYATCQVYVQPSRGEGFGLQPLQAMATGMPTILTNAHGHAAFADLAIPLDWTFQKSDYFIYGDAGDWWEPDFEQLCEAMWDTYSHYGEHLDRAAQVAQEIIPFEWTWEQTADAYLDALGDTINEPPVPFDIYRPTMKLYWVRLNRDWRADIAGFLHIYQADQDYWESADTKRIMFEAGLLDPVCVRPEDGRDTGLLPEQLGRIEEYSSAHGRCPMCEQYLNTDPRSFPEAVKITAGTA